MDFLSMNYNNSNGAAKVKVILNSEVQIIRLNYLID